MDNKISKVLQKINSKNYIKEVPRIIKKMDILLKIQAIEEIGKLLDHEDYQINLKALKVLSELSIPEILPPIIDTMENMKFNKNDVERICKKKTTEEKEDKENYTEKDEIK
ncbi:MAG TPA: hypothetical protein PL110_06905, partial [Candidatus Eremiobacteraeota bacterium]|nr:hypothetical protein [Candidatus Eremiobacteraeota bacterium]